MTGHRTWTMMTAALAMATFVAAQTPQPFPRPNQPGAKPAQPATPQPAPGTPAPGTSAPPGTSSADSEAPTAAQLGFPLYPTAQFITSYDAGRGQRYYLFGAAAPFAELVQFYRTALKEKGNLVFEQPPTHMFEIGRFREETMAFPPGVTIKDFMAGGSGYPNPKRGAQPERFATIIQIVPAQPQAAAPPRR